MTHLQIKPKYDISLSTCGMTDSEIIAEVTYLLRREGVPQHEIEEFRTQVTTRPPDYDFGFGFLRIVLSWVGVVEMSEEQVACLEEGDDELWRLHDEHEANLELEADLHGTDTQMYKDTLALLGRLKKECQMYEDTLALLGRLKKN